MNMNLTASAPLKVCFTSALLHFVPVERGGIGGVSSPSV